jgi:hypothetical protein
MVDNTAGNATGMAGTPHPRTAGEKSRLNQIVSQDFTTAVLAYVTTGGFFVLIGLLLFVSWLGSGILNPADKAALASAGVVGALTNGPFHDLLNTLVGIVGTAWATIIGFYFGSSSGSRQQMQTLSEVALSRNPSPTGPTTGRTEPASTGTAGSG